MNILSIFRRIASVNGQPVCWHRTEWQELSCKQGGTAENTFSVLVPHGERGLFYLERSSFYEEKPGQTMAGVTNPKKPSYHIIMKENFL